MSGAAAENPKPTKPLPYQKKRQRLWLDLRRKVLPDLLNRPDRLAARGQIP
jgi:hypothetical protein